MNLKYSSHPQIWSGLLSERKPNICILTEMPALFTSLVWRCVGVGGYGTCLLFFLLCMFCAPLTFLSCFLSSILIFHPTYTGAEGQILLCTEVL